MARIDLEVSEDLLEWVDDYAGRAGESRDEFLLHVIEDEIERCHNRLSKQMEELLDSHPLDLGGKTAAELIREGRNSR